MHSRVKTVWLPRFSTFILFALAAGSAAFWSLKIMAPPPPPTVLAVGHSPTVRAESALVARALGGVAAATARASVASPALAASRFVLTGVIAAQSQSGASLIAVDGKPPKPFVVGARVGEDWILQSVQPRRAVLARVDATGQQAAAGGPELVLELPVPPSANKGKNSL